MSRRLRHPRDWHLHHKISFSTMVTAVVSDFVCGVLYAHFQHIPLWHGLYCALANGVTIGGDVSPTTNGGYWVNTVECFVVIPLFVATFTFFTSGLAAVELRRAVRSPGAQPER